MIITKYTYKIYTVEVFEKRRIASSGTNLLRLI
jgi:hypothetical protein